MGIKEEKKYLYNPIPVIGLGFKDGLIFQAEDLFFMQTSL